MTLELTSDIVIQCEECGKIITISKDEVEEEGPTVVDERGMGAEYEYVFSGCCQCEGFRVEESDDEDKGDEEVPCENEMSFEIHAWEYPEGALNCVDYVFNGCEFVEEPRISVVYPDDFD